MRGAFSMLGEVVPLDERLFDAATALSGSGPAFLGLILEAFEDAGIVSGLAYDDARRLLLSTVIGTAELLRAEDALLRIAAADGHLAGRHRRRRAGRDGAAGRARRDDRRRAGRDAAGRGAGMSTTLVEQFLVSLGLVYTGFIFLHIILGYLQLSYSPWLGRLRALTYDTVEPYLRWWRNIIPSAGGLDFSPIVGIVAINVGVGIVLADPARRSREGTGQAAVEARRHGNLTRRTPARTTLGFGSSATAGPRWTRSWAKRPTPSRRYGASAPTWTTACTRSRTSSPVTARPRRRCATRW